MKNKFTKGDIKIGYVVELRNGDLKMAMRCNQDEFEKILIGENNCYCCFEDIEEDLTGRCYKQLDIMKIYGLSETKAGALIISTKNRPLLWEREETIEMTMDEVCKELGKQVKIVDKHREDN